MQLNRLTLTQFRVFEQVTFDFQPGMNLIVGVNGAGKSTVLDALRVMLSQVLPRFTASSRSNAQRFSGNDITIGRGALTAILFFAAAGITFEHFIHLPREQYVADKSKEGEVRDQTYDLVERNDLKPDGKALPKQLKRSVKQPLAVYFSTHRSLFNAKQSSAGGQAAAFADALADDRGLRLREFAEWWLVQEELARESDTVKQRLTALETALTRFLDTCSNPRAVREPEPTLLLDKEGTKLLGPKDIKPKEGVRFKEVETLEGVKFKEIATLDVRQLSDGERGVLALVLDLARRLAQANPGLEDPLHDGKAVVLIDELDLHLHPRWQRTIVEKLTSTFPNCQFIATTHSPQILGEVPPECIILLESGRQPYRPDQSLGMDSNWILQFLMGTSDRNILISQKLDKIADLIEEEEYDQAGIEISRLREQMPDDLELIKLQTRLDRLQILGE